MFNTQQHKPARKTIPNNTNLPGKQESTTQTCQENNSQQHKPARKKIANNTNLLLMCQSSPAHDHDM
jgi:hypothetical protein